MAKFVHHAIVRRDVVVELITKAKERGHRSYRHINLERVQAKANAFLPENGVPPEIAKLIPYDDLLDKIQIQKAATPVTASTRKGRFRNSGYYVSTNQTQRSCARKE